jgi:hypothetical protein
MFALYNYITTLARVRERHPHIHDLTHARGTANKPHARRTSARTCGANGNETTCVGARRHRPLDTLPHRERSEQTRR